MADYPIITEHVPDPAREALRACVTAMRAAKPRLARGRDRDELDEAIRGAEQVLEQEGSGT